MPGLEVLDAIVEAPAANRGVIAFYAPFYSDSPFWPSWPSAAVGCGSSSVAAASDSGDVAVVDNIHVTTDQLDHRSSCS